MASSVSIIDEYQLHKLVSEEGSLKKEKDLKTVCKTAGLYLDDLHLGKSDKDFDQISENKSMLVPYYLPLPLD
jgi:hypothetical protein